MHQCRSLFLPFFALYAVGTACVVRTAPVSAHSTASAAVETPPPGPPPPASSGRKNALRLNGVDSYAASSKMVDDPFTEAATLSAWFRLEEVPSRAHHIFHIVGKSGSGRDLDLQVETDDRIHFYVATGAPHTVVSSTVTRPNVWYRVDATYRAKREIVLYVNRIVESTRPIPDVTRRPNDGPITIGENATFKGRFFKGLIDEVAIWNHALSPQEISSLTPTMTGREAGLEALYHFDDDGSDASTHGHGLALVGAAVLEPPGGPF